MTYIKRYKFCISTDQGTLCKLQNAFCESFHLSNLYFTADKLQTYIKINTGLSTCFQKIKHTSLSFVPWTVDTDRVYVLFTVLVGGLKIQMENNTFKCPKDGCGKNFRKENLLQVGNISIQLNINSIYMLFYIYLIRVTFWCVEYLHIPLIWNFTVLQFLLYKIILKLSQMELFVKTTIIDIFLCTLLPIGSYYLCFVFCRVICLCLQMVHLSLQDSTKITCIYLAGLIWFGLSVYLLCYSN